MAGRRGTSRKLLKRAVSYQKRAVSLPKALARAVDAQVRAKNATSFSAFVADALGEKLERNGLQALLDEVWAKEPMTDEERAWADKILGD
jgi:Arc/MetJ-type ribon-helix-helix transcriptional regulator